MDSVNRSPNTSQDQRLQVKTLFHLGFSPRQISERLGFTLRQVRYSLSCDSITPRKSTGRPSVLTSEQVDDIESFICSSRVNRQMSYLELAYGPLRHLGVGEKTIASALKKRGYSRRLTQAKPPISEKNRKIRRQWAEDHRYWTVEHWQRVLWSDITWVNDDQHRRRWITSKAGEELEPSCTVDKTRKRRHWMFWGCFSGSVKGPCLFWEREWGSIDTDRYNERIVPLISSWMRETPNLILMQNGAPSHSTSRTLAELSTNGIQPMTWPAYSPDLNPIEAVWSQMKDFIERKYPDLPDDKDRSFDEISVIVREAWDSVTPENLAQLVKSMPRRCQAVIDVDGGYTKY